MNPESWTNADPSTLPIGPKQADKSDEDCIRCGETVGLDGAKYCEQCHKTIQRNQLL